MYNETIFGCLKHFDRQIQYIFERFNLYSHTLDFNKQVFYNNILYI